MILRKSVSGTWYSLATKTAAAAAAVVIHKEMMIEINTLVNDGHNFSSGCHFLDNMSNK